MPQPKPVQGSKFKRRKSRYIRFDSPWTGVHKETQKRANRRSRKGNGVAVEAVMRKSLTPPQGKKKVAGNRCGNECGYRAEVGDYLCSRCRH